MSLEDILPAEGGEVTLLRMDFRSALGLEGEGPPAVCYCVLKRPGGFLLALPPHFLPEEVLDGARAENFVGLLGPHISTTAPAVELSDAGEWLAPSPPRMLEVLLVDFEDAAAAGVEVLEEGLAECVPFLEVAPSLFPLATALVTFATAWISGLEGERGAGYVTAEELIPDVAPKALSRKAKPEAKKKPTVAVLAAQQLEIAEALQALTTQVQHLALSGSREERTPQQVKAPSQVSFPPRASARGALAAPVSSTIAASPVGPRTVADLLGPPPRNRGPIETVVDLEEGQAVPFSTGEEFAEGGGGGAFAAAMMAQSRALTALVAQIANASDPLSELSPGASSSLSTKGSNSRLRLQQELGARGGTFYKRVQEAALRRMEPTADLSMIGEVTAGKSVMCRYLERYGGFRDQRTWGLVQWQLGQVFDLLGSGQVEGAKDTLALLMLMVDQLVLDAGSPELGWILTLQQDPPASLFSAPSNVPGSSLRPYSHLSDPKWIATALAFVKEMETLANRRAEISRKATPASPASTHEGPPAPLSKKQHRAKLWAERKAASQPKG